MNPSQPSEPQVTTTTILNLFAARGASRYGGEDVTQLEHALQAAHFAEAEGAPAELISAALLHDIGHLLHGLPEEAPDEGIDDVHEALGHRWLERHFGPAVCEPVRLHVAAKRYLCATEASYFALLSRPSIVSLGLQGGPMTPEEVDEFRRHPHCEAAVRLRRWDDAAKVRNLPTPDLGHFAVYLDQALLSA